MEKFQLDYSDKNIPVASRTSFIKKFINQTENFIKRLRWKVFHYEKSKENTDETNNETFGFKTLKTPPKNCSLNEFEDDLFELIKNIEFTERPNDFQKKLAKDLKEIKNSKKIIVPADKTSNFYKLDVTTYKKLVIDAVTKG